MKPIFVNNAASLLAAPLTPTSSDIKLTAGFGVLFPNPASGEYFTVTLENQQATTREIVRIGSKTGDILHVLIRGDEGTTAQAWTTTPPTLVDHRITAGEMNLLFNLLNSEIVREIPTGVINGTNVVFTLQFMPVSNSENVYLNGLLLDSGINNDYTISGAVITFATAPLVNDKIRASYKAIVSQ